MTAAERAKRLIDRNTNMVLTTADPARVPWVSPVFYVADESYDLYWTSDPEARHSANVRRNPNVALVIFKSDPVDAVYIAAHAVEITDIDDASRAAQVMRGKSQPDRWVIDETSPLSSAADLGASIAQHRRRLRCARKRSRAESPS